MCDAPSILDLSTLGVMQFRDGKRQEAMDHFQASMANLLTYISSQKKANEAEPTETRVAKRSRSGEVEEEAQMEMPPMKRPRRKGPAASSSRAQSTDGPQPLPPPQTTGPSPLPPKQPRSSSSPPPYPLSISFETPTADTFPELSVTLFNQVLVFPSSCSQDGNGQCSSSHKDQCLPQENYDVFYASLMYNMGLVLHNHGLQHSCGKSLRKALESYEVAHAVLLHDLQRPPSSRPSSWDTHHWLSYAILNNMANIYTVANSKIMTRYCLERLRGALAHSDSNLLGRPDLLFFMVNLDVLGAGGPGVISAAAA